MFLSRLVVAVAAVLAVTASPAAAECKPYALEDTVNTYVEYQRSSYTICHGRGLTQDRNLVRKWVDAAFRLGRQKYNVRNRIAYGYEFKLTIYLPEKPTFAASKEQALFRCCFEDRRGAMGSNGQTLHHAEIHYLTPSSWEGDELGGLKRPPAHFHPHVVVHEMTHFFQFLCCSEKARDRGYGVPTWIREGMAESDGWLHTTSYNRRTGLDKLAEWFLDYELGNVIWGRDLNLKRTFGVSSEYTAGGFVMNFLADSYGEKIHRELLLDELGVVLDEHTSSITDVFVDLHVLTEEMKGDVEESGYAYSATGVTGLSPAKPVGTPQPPCNVHIVFPWAGANHD